MYNFATFDPRPADKVPAAHEANEKVFASGPVFGIEVTIPALAKRCIANLDPQHSGQNANAAAIEEALYLVEFPPEGATLATVRADLDSVGAMAVIVFQQEGGLLDDATLERIKLIAESDKFARGGWPGTRFFPTEFKPFDDSTASTESDSRLAPIASAIGDFKILLAQRVEWMKTWLLSGEEPVGYREKFVSERVALAKAIANGSIDAKVTAGGKVAVVISTHRAATSVGYHMAPVVIALNPKFRFQGGDPHAKFTICQFETGYVNMKAVLTDLAEMESGWGGSPTIGGSPQGISSKITVDQVVATVSHHLLK